MYIFSFNWPREASSVMPEGKDVKDIEERESVSILEQVLSNQNTNPQLKQTPWSNFKQASHCWQFCLLVLCSHQHFKPFHFKMSTELTNEAGDPILYWCSQPEKWRGSDLNGQADHPSSYHSFKSLCSSNLLRDLQPIWFPLPRPKFSETSR